jgi:lipopolysaccharide cholinephosphotransferase
MSERDVLWMGALQISSNHPILGYGPYTFSEIFPFPDQLKDTKIGGWHNDYIQVYIESGSLSLLAMLWLMITIYRQTFVSIRNTKNDKQKIILALAAGISAIFLSSLTGSAFLNVLIRILFGFLLALLALLIKQDGKENLNAAEGNYLA